MAGIRSRNTLPEILVRNSLHRKGFRFRLHSKKLPGKPDIVLKKYNSLIFVNGCFWHRHNCKLFKWPRTRARFWKSKLDRNYENDRRAIQILSSDGWRICVVWECSIKSAQADRPSVLDLISSWLVGGTAYLEISG